MGIQGVEDETLLQRALAAYYRPIAGQSHNAGRTAASAIKSHIAEHLGKRYVVLENFDGVLAVYRVRNDGILKALRRWPAEIAEGRMTYAFVVTAEAPGVTTAQVRELSKILAHAYSGDASIDGASLTARLKIPQKAPVSTAEQAESAARRYVTISGELVGIEHLKIMQAQAR
ncbi:MAG: hypothetical protein ACRDPY_25290 [Streptosporangiaceae bacterium]